MTRTIHVRVDHERCVGNAWCTRLAPDVFALDASRQSVAATPVVEQVARVLDAAANCPVLAIVVHDAATGEQLFP